MLSIKGKMRHVYTLLLFLIAGPQLFSQSYSMLNNQTASVRITKMTLAVVKKTPDRRFLNVYSKSQFEDDRYLKLVEQYNQHIEEIVRSRWTYSPEIEVITEDRVEEIKKSEDKKKYAFLELKEVDLGFISSPYIAPVVAVTEATEKRNLVAMEVFQWLPLTKGLLTYHVDQLIKQLNDSQKGVDTYSREWRQQIQDRTSQLKDKTVLLCSAWVTKEFLKEIEDGSWKVEGDVSLKIVSQADLEQYIIDRDKNFAFIFLASSKFIVVDISTGNFLYMKGSYNYTPSNRIPPKFLVDVVEDGSRK